MPVPITFLDSRRLTICVRDPLTSALRDATTADLAAAGYEPIDSQFAEVADEHKPIVLRSRWARTRDALLVTVLHLDPFVVRFLGDDHETASFPRDSWYRDFTWVSDP